MNKLDKKIRHHFKKYLSSKIGLEDIFGILTSSVKGRKFIIISKSSLNNIEELFLEFCKKNNYDDVIDMYTVNILENVKTNYIYIFNYEYKDYINVSNDMDLV